MHECGASEPFHSEQRRGRCSSELIRHPNTAGDVNAFIDDMRCVGWWYAGDTTKRMAMQTTGHRNVPLDGCACVHNGRRVWYMACLDPRNWSVLPAMGARLPLAILEQTCAALHREYLLCH